MSVVDIVMDIIKKAIPPQRDRPFFCNFLSFGLDGSIIKELKVKNIPFFITDEEGNDYERNIFDF